LSDYVVTISEENINIKIQEETLKVKLDGIYYYPADEGEIMKTHQAGANIEAYRVVKLGSDGLLYHCQGNVISDNGKALGISLNAGSVGDAINVKYVGNVTYAPNDLTPGEDYFVGIDGVLVDKPVGLSYEQKVGVATASNELFVNIAGVEIDDAFEATAAEDLSGFTVIVFDSNGNLIHADSSNVGHADKIAGVTLQAGLTNTNVYVKNAGEISDPSWSWDTTKNIFFDTNGTLTQTVPNTGFVCSVGYPIDSKTIFIDINNSIIL